MLCLKQLCSLSGISKGFLTSSTRGILNSVSLPSSSSLLQQPQYVDSFRSFASASKSKTAAKTATKTTSKAKPAAKSAAKSAAKPAAKGAKPAAKPASKTAAAAKPAVKKPIITSKKAPVKAKVVVKVKVSNPQKESMMREKIKQKREQTKEREIAMRLKEKERNKLKKEKEKQAAEKEKVKQEKVKERERKANAPKRNLTPFTFFMKKEIPLWKAAHPKTPFSKDVFRQLSAKWQKTSDSERKSFVSEAAKDKARYLKEKEVVAKNAPPKRPLTPYLLFANETRPAVVKENPQMSIVEVAQKIGGMWTRLNSTEQEKYRKAYKKATDEFNKKYPNMVSAK